MKKKLLLMFVFVCASFLYGVVNAQTYEGFIGADDWQTVGTPQDATEGYAPDFSYQISVVEDGKLQVTVDLSATCVGLVPQLVVNGKYTNLEPVAGSSSQFSGTTPDAYEIGETLRLSFYFAYAGGVSDTNAFDYVVGSTNEALDDSEAPVVSMFELEGVSSTKADVRLLVNDNVASSVKVEFSVDGFSSVLQSQKVAVGTETVCTLSGLTPATAYDLAVRATDDADNVSEVKTLSFSTLDADAESYYYGVVASADEWAENTGDYRPVINYIVKTTADNQLEFTMTLDSGTDGLVNPEIWVNGVNTATAPTGEELTYTGITKASFKRGATVTFYFRLVYAGGGASATLPISFVVGSANEKPAEDVEAPVLNSVSAGNVTGYSADITVNATDNQSASLTVEVASDEAFESVLATSRVASGEDGVCTLDNLTPQTEYTLYVRVSDLAGNVSDVKTVTFTTLEPADAVAFVGSIAADGWAVTGTPEGETEVFAPSVSYEIVTTRENRLQFRLSLDRVCPGLGVEVWIDDEPFFKLQQPQAENAVNLFEGENSRSYPRGTTLNIRFRFPFTGGVSETKPFEFEVGSKSGGSSVDDFVADAVRVYGANCELRVCCASGSQCCVYDLSGRLVMSCLVDGQEAVYSLNKGLYVVVVGGSVSKVVL